MLAARSLQVLVVSFGSLAGAQIWLEQTGCTFNMVLDPQKKVEILVFNEFNSLELDTFEDGMFSTWRKRIFCVWVWSLFRIKHGGLLQVYRSFGLGSSYAHVMRFDCMLRYSEYEANDRNFPDFPSYLLGNIYQVDITFSWSSKCEFDGVRAMVLSSTIIGLFSRWEETFCWTKGERSSLVTAVKRHWTGRLWRTSFRPRTRQGIKRSRKAWL